MVLLSSEVIYKCYINIVMNKLYKNKLDEDIDELLMSFVYLDNLKDMDLFVTDLLTETEIRLLATRWKAVRMLYAGIPYSKIGQATSMSSATISRLSKLLKRRNSGFNVLLSNMS